MSQGYLSSTGISLAIHAFALALLLTLGNLGTPTQSLLQPQPKQSIKANVVSQSQLQAFTQEKARLKRQEQRRLQRQREAERKRQEAARLERERIAEQKRLEQQRLEQARLAELQRREQMRLEQQRLAQQRHLERERQRIAQQQYQAQKKREEQERQAQLKREQALAEQKRLEQQRIAEQKRREKEKLEQQLQQEMADIDAAHTAYVDQQIAHYQSLIQNTIKRHWFVEPDLAEQSCRIALTLAPDGFILDIKTLSGSERVCKAAKLALRKIDVLPVPQEPGIFEKFREFVLTMTL